MDTEIIFVIEEAEEGGFFARALGYSIFSQGETLEELREMVREAVNLHFDEEDRPPVIRLHRIYDEVIPA